MEPAGRRSIRRILGILIVLISLVLLIWGIWPFQEVAQTIFLQPVDLQLPTPESLFPLLVWFV